MLRLIPAPLHRAGYVMAHAVRLRWWRITRARLLGCRVLAFDDAGRVLLVRHSYGSRRWMLPGGGLGRRENPLDGARRELAEETGCALHDARLLLTVDEPLYGTVNRVHLVAGWIDGTPRGDGREVVAAALFDPASLPPDTAPALLRDLPGWIAAARAAPGAV